MSFHPHLSSVNGLHLGLNEFNFVTPPELSLSAPASGHPMEKSPAAASPVGVESLRPAMKAGGGVKGHPKLCSRGHWRPAEDAKLKELVAKFGPQNWNLIAENLDGRSGKSCRLRWFNQLDPRINKKAFTEEEEERLLTAHRLNGNKWAVIARLFPGRTDNAVKNHWHVIMARRQREQQHPGSTHRKRMSKSESQNAAAGSDSTITSNVDELGGVGSTCTVLSLSPASVKKPDLTLSCPNPGLTVNNWANSKVMEGVSSSKNPSGSAPATVMEMGNRGISDSEVSAFDSVTSNSLPEEFGSRQRKSTIPILIDFLGVGTD